MQLNAEILQVRQSLAEAEDEALRWGARVEGLRTQLEALQRAETLSKERKTSQTTQPDLRALNRTSAIEQVLRSSPAPLTIAQVLKALDVAGRKGDHYAVVAATLQQLLKQGRVRRPNRGLYQAS